jgi:muramoyltetrapeptide carboxypeptidase
VTPLLPGDRVALVAPAGPTPPAEVDRAVDVLTSWGLKADVSPSAAAAHPRASYLAADDAVRAQDIQDAWCDPDVAAVLCMRGGYGTMRTLDLLDRGAMAAAGHTPLFGSSDVTALHEWLREELGASTWFAPMIGFRATLDDEVALSGLRSALLDDPGPRRWTSPAATTLRPGTAEGMLVGGNLSLLAMTLAARNRRPPDHSGCIVLLEDITEPTYRLDGYLTALLRAGWFDGVAGIALGSWKECGPLDEIHDLFLELLGPLDVPIVGELGFGHCVGAHSIPLGIPGVLQADDDPALEADMSDRS